jgi:hypothetical protein
LKDRKRQGNATSPTQSRITIEGDGLFAGGAAATIALSSRGDQGRLPTMAAVCFIRFNQLQLLAEKVWHRQMPTR